METGWDPEPSFTVPQPSTSAPARTPHPRRTPPSSPPPPPPLPPFPHPSRRLWRAGGAHAHDVVARRLLWPAARQPEQAADVDAQAGVHRLQPGEPRPSCLLLRRLALCMSKLGLNWEQGSAQQLVTLGAAGGRATGSSLFKQREQQQQRGLADGARQAGGVPSAPALPTSSALPAAHIRAGRRQQGGAAGCCVGALQRAAGWCAPEQRPQYGPALWPDGDCGGKGGGSAARNLSLLRHPVQSAWLSNLTNRQAGSNAASRRFGYRSFPGCLPAPQRSCAAPPHLPVAGGRGRGDCLLPFGSQAASHGPAALSWGRRCGRRGAALLQQRVLLLRCSWKAAPWRPPQASQPACK